MICAFLLIIFFIYSFVIFFINNFFILFILFLINIILFFNLNVNFKNKIYILKNNIIFIIFIFLCNWIFCNFDMAFLTSFKIFNVLILTYIVSKKLTPDNFIEGIYILLIPLKIFKINIKDVALIITISLTFIPILIEEARDIKKSLLMKGLKFNLKNCFLKPHIYLITYLNSLFKRLGELEKSLIMKAFE